MKILIAADMEGISGVTKWDHVDPDHAEYNRFREIMTRDVNAAVRGAYEGGANEVIVSDGHADGTNILIEQMEPRASLNTGNDSPLSMIQGIGADVDGVILVGYHARAGSEMGILAHTWSNSRVANVWLNDLLVGECGINAAVCGHFGCPILMITGDQAVCAEAEELLGPLEGIVVKQATSFCSAECLSPAVSQEKIFQGAVRAVRNHQAGKSPKPFNVKKPVRVLIEFLGPHHADGALYLPGSTRLDGRKIEFISANMLEAYSGFRAAVGLA